MPHIFVPDDIYGKFHHRLEFFVPIRPKAMERGRFLRNRKYPKPYTVREDINYQDQVKLAFERASIHESNPLLYPWAGPVFITMHFMFKVPKTNWWPGKPYTSTPDVDNLTKNIMDAMNSLRKKETKEGTVTERSVGAWIDDKQVCGYYGTKSYFETEGTLVVVDFYNNGEQLECPQIQLINAPTVVVPEFKMPVVEPSTSAKRQTTSSRLSRRRLPVLTLKL